MDRIDILLVDDRPENLTSLEGLLESQDLNFIRALSGEEALESTLSHRPALVLLDVQMPDMDGFEVARLLRSTERTREIPIIFVTATHREEKFTFQGFESGAVDYLFKPLNPVVVRSKVKVFVELHRNRMRLERAIQDLSLLNEELRSFSYSVSHDLKAPLRSMLGFTKDVLDEPDQMNEQQVKKLNRVVAAGERMQRLIDSLLDLSKVTQSEIQRNPVDLTTIVKQLCEELRQEQKDRALEFQVAENVKVVGDKRLLENAMSNLINNAVKFTGKNKSARVEFGVNHKKGRPVFFVRDNGIGFNMKYVDRLFGPFQRLHNEKEFPGSGVGLATVQRIVHRHGGRIWAESEAGESTTFYFTLE